MMVQHFLSCQISCFAAIFGVGDPHYRYLDAKSREDVHGGRILLLSSLQVILRAA